MASSNVTDGGATTQQVGGGTFNAGEIEEVNGIVEDSSVAAAAETEHEWVVEIVSGDVVDTDTLDFRVQWDDGAGYADPDTLTVTPRLTIGLGAQADVACKP